MQGWIKIHRKLHEWEWYKDSKMVHLFLHLLMSANHEEKSYQGFKIKRGQLVTGRKMLSAKTGISEQSIRTCLSKLKSTSEITIKTTNKNSIITLLNYDLYQERELKKQNQPTEQPTTNQQTNQQSTTNKNGKKKKNEKKKEIYIPSENEFLEHAISKQPNINHFAVVSKYQQWVDDGWKDGYGNEIKSWKHKLNNTIPHIKTDNNGKGFNELQQQAIDNIAREYNI